MDPEVERNCQWTQTERVSNGFKALGRGLILVHNIGVRVMFVILNMTEWEKYAN
jgi:hypothetical protein